MRKLRRQFPYTPDANEAATTSNKSLPETDKSNAASNEDSADEFDMKKAIRNVKKSKKQFAAQISLPKINLDDYKLPGDDTEADMLENDDDAEAAEADLDNEEDEETKMSDDATPTTKQPLWVLPLYSLLSSESKIAYFSPHPLFFVACQHKCGRDMANHFEY